MATGWPMKTTYADGDVYSAQDVNDITGTVNLLQTSTLSYQAGKNRVINGGMDIWQRGTSFTGASPYYTADRFQGMRHSQVSGITVTRQTTGDTTNLPTIQYCARIQRDSGNTSTNALYFGSVIETINSIPLAGQTVTMSFYARKGANYSAASNGLNVRLISGTGTDQNNTFTGSFTSATDVISQTATLTSTWQRFSYTATIGATATELQVLVYETPVGTASTNDYYEVTGFQLELGSYATTFSRAGGTIQNELAACQRYFQKSWATETAVGTNTDVGVSVRRANASSQVYYLELQTQLWVVMRTLPTITWWSQGSSGNIQVNGSNRSVNATYDIGYGNTGYPYISGANPAAGNDTRAQWTASAEI
jgi:hypothetical protein